MTGITEAEARLKRLKIRSWRRGTREMDLLLGAYADARLSDMSEGELDGYEALLHENDQDLYAWIAGKAAPDPRHEEAVGRVAAHHGIERRVG